MKSKSGNLESSERQDKSMSSSLTDPSSQLFVSEFLSGQAKAVRSSSKAARDEENNHTSTTCGIGSWRPKWMQGMASPFFFMLNLGLVGVIQGMTGTIFFSSISTLEKRFAFDSKVSGVILIADNFADMILNPIIGYLGVRYNRARLIGIGELVLAFGSFLTASPYFIYGPGTHLLDASPLQARNGTNFEMCPADHSLEHCENNESATVWLAVVIFILGSWFRGMGYTCYFVVGLPYLDDNIKKEQSPMYISILQAIRLIGPACGFMLTSLCLSFYEDPFFDPGVGRTDPRYVGAWWLSFVIVGVLLFFAAIPMFFFPFEFKNATVKAEDIKHKMKESGGSKGALKRFVSNPVVILYVLGNIFRYIGIGGYVMFKSKYIESQFRKSSSSASFITGTASFLPMALGIMIGGSVISFFKPRPRTVFILVFIVEGISFFTVGSGLFLGCDPINISGRTTDLGSFSLDASCNGNCECSTRIYTPICGPDSQTTYFSPCHAGCTSYNPFNSTFEGCSCFTGSATKGYCASDVTNCNNNNLVKYISVVAAGSFISSVARTPNSLIYLRSVDPIDKGFAIGLASTLLDIFAFVPYPLLFGYIADSSCLIWESKCGKTGNCWVYDHDKFRNYLHGAAITFFAIGSCFDFMLIFFADRVKNFYEEEEEAKKSTVAIELTDSKTDESIDALTLRLINGDQKILFIDEMTS